MLYDVNILTLQPGTTNQALGKLKTTFTSAGFQGEWLACWLSDIGALNQILLMRSYPDFGALEIDRRSATLHSDPFGIKELIAEATSETYTPFPFVEPLRAGRKSAFYEVRTYVLKPAGLGPTIESWRQALPDRIKLSPLLTAMHTLTGPTPRFMHIWPYDDLVARHRIRTQAVEAGIWPPPGGPGRLLSQRTDIYVPAAFSPL